MALIHVAADIHPLMARDAAERLEQLVARELLGGYRVSVAAEPSIKSASRREEGPLIGRDGAEECRTVDLPVRYTGFEIPDKFVVGYGLDFAERYRNLTSIGVLKAAKQKLTA